MVSPTYKKPVVLHMMSHHPVSERKACQLVGLSRTGYRYQASEKTDTPLRERMKVLATSYPRYGYLLLHGLLKNESLVINKKRTYRIYTEEKLQVRTKKRKKLQRPRVPMSVPSRVNERWSMDFVSDQLFNGRRFRVFNIIDDYSREMIDQLVSVSISGNRVARFLNDLAQSRPLPKSIVCDNGTEFTSKAMFFWSAENNVKLDFIQPGKPTQNPFVESFNGKFRDNCLSLHWFKSMEDAKEKIDSWRNDYNNVRPHSSLNYMTPVAFAAKAA